MTFASRTQFHVDRGVNACLAQGLNSVLNVKAVVAAFNQEKALVGAFSVITTLRMDLFEALVLAVARQVCVPAIYTRQSTPGHQPVASRRLTS